MPVLDLYGFGSELSGRMCSLVDGKKRRVKFRGSQCQVSRHSHLKVKLNSHCDVRHKMERCKLQDVKQLVTIKGTEHWMH